MNLENRIRVAFVPLKSTFIGLPRALLFNMLFRDSYGGKIILRIDDTDGLRAQPERLKIVFDTLHWLGINWNEGPDIGGEYEPYIQSERKSSYLKATEHLIKKNRAYRCFCNQSANSHGCLRDCKKYSQNEIDNRLSEGQQYCVRYCINNEIESYFDLIHGEIHKEFSSMIRIARLYNASFRINILRPTVDFSFALPYKNLKDNFINLIREYEVESIADPLLAALVEADCPNGDPTAESSFRILPNGYVTPSTYLLDADWQVKRLDEIDNIDSMHELDSFKKIKAVEIPQSCGKCRMREICKGGVFDRRWLWYHDFSENDPYCPLRFGDSLDWKQLSGNVIYSKKRKSFVHDGYLPTLIFNPIINARALSRWDNIYLNYRSSYNSNEPDQYILKAEEITSQKTKRKVLDLGSGLGRNGKYFLSKGDYVSFIESSKVANDILVKSLLDKNIMSGYSVIECDIVEFLENEKNESFDIVLAMHIISHGTIDIIASSYIKNIYRVLKKNGIACITLPSITDERCPNHGADIYEYTLEDGPEKGIVHSFYSEAALLREINGFEVLEIDEKTNDNGNAHWNLILRKR